MEDLPEAEIRPSMEEQLEFLTNELYQVKVFFYVDYSFSIDWSNGFHPIYYCNEVKTFKEFKDAIYRAYKDVKGFIENRDDYESFYEYMEEK